MSKTKITSQDLLDFEKFYKQQALEFFRDNNLGIQTEYEHVSRDEFIVTDKRSLRNKINSYGREEDISSVINRIGINPNNLYFKDYGKPFFKKLYLSSNEKQREIIHNGKYVLFSFDDHCEALESNPTELIDFVKKSKNANTIITSSMHLRRTVESWKRSLTENDFNDLVLNYFTMNQN